jgi:hypothetical protein
MLFGTFLSDPTMAASEAAVGVRVVHLELGWDRHEPQDGVFDAAYVDQARQRLQAFQDANLLLGLADHERLWLLCLRKSLASRR